MRSWRMETRKGRRLWTLPRRERIRQERCVLFGHVEQRYVGAWQEWSGAVLLVKVGFVGVRLGMARQDWYVWVRTGSARLGAVRQEWKGWDRFVKFWFGVARFGSGRNDGVSHVVFSYGKDAWGRERQEGLGTFVCVKARSGMAGVVR